MELDESHLAPPKKEPPPNRYVEPKPEVLTPAKLGKLQVSTVEQDTKFVNMILFGDSGVGKTRLAGSASLVPEMSPVLILDIEGGVTSLAHLYPDVHTIRIKNFQDLADAYDTLFDGDHPYKTVVVDSLTEVQKFGMYHIMERTIAADGNRDPDLPGIGEWGKNTNQIEKFVRAFRDLPVNTIFTALKLEDRNPRTGVTTTLPSLSGKLARNVSALVDVVAYYYIKKLAEDDSFHRLLLTTKTEEIVAKDRSDNLPAVIIDPDMTILYNYITHKTKRNDPKTVSPEETNE